MFKFHGLAVAVVIFYVFINSVTTVEQIYCMKPVAFAEWAWSLQLLSNEEREWALKLQLYLIANKPYVAVSLRDLSFFMYTVI